MAGDKKKEKMKKSIVRDGTINGGNRDVALGVGGDLLLCVCEDDGEGC